MAETSWASKGMRIRPWHMQRPVQNAISDALRFGIGNAGRAARDPFRSLAQFRRNLCGEFGDGALCEGVVRDDVEGFVLCDGRFQRQAEGDGEVADVDVCPEAAREGERLLPHAADDIRPPVYEDNIRRAD